MKRKGISLIVLIITIVTIIILATAIIVNIAQTNLIENANEAVVKQDFKTMQDELTLYKADKYADTLGKFKAEDLDVTDKAEIAKIMPSIVGSKYEEYVLIENGCIAISDDMPEQERKWAMEALGLIKTSTNRPTQNTTKPTVPTALELTVVENNITAVASGSTDDNEFAYEYSIDSIAWEANGEFKDLESAKEYTVYARAKDNVGNISDTIEKSITTKYNIVAVNETVVGGNALLAGETPSYNNPVIPVGFKAINTTKATWTNSNNTVSGWNNGLVIQDENENEYVWIPVDGTTVKYEKWNGSMNTDYTVTKEQVEDDTLPKGVTSEEYQINIYGGFYVARYEAGLPDSQTTAELMETKIFSADDNNRTDIGKAQSKANKIVWNRISYNNAKIVSENAVSTKHVQSGLITGTQWDTMLDFLSQVVNVDTNCITWGNYYDKYGYTINGYYRTQYDDVVYTNGKYTKPSNGYLLLQTGGFGSVVTEGSPKNIFDVAGNIWEWSAETVIEKGGQYTTMGNKLLRGGGCNYHGSFGVATSRYGHTGSTNANTFPDVGFRIVLYVK